MKKYLLSIITILTLSYLNTYAQTSDITYGCVPLKVNFQAPNSSVGYFWDFGDGSFSYDQITSNQFLKSGNYTVTLKESETGKVVGTLLINVYDKPTITFSISQNIGCSPLNTTFTNTTILNSNIKVLDYIWVFGDGTGGNGNSVSHSFLNTGKYDITLKINTEMPTCNQTVIKTEAIEVISSPVASFNTSPTNTLTCDSTIDITYSSTSTGVKPLNYLWVFKNGDTARVANPGKKTFKNGNFYPSLTVNYTGIQGCSSSFYSNVSVGKPSANITLNQDSVCVKSAVRVSTNSQGIIKWSFGNDATTNNYFTPKTFSFLKDDSVFYSFDGKKQIILEVTSFNGQCKTLDTANIYVEDFDVEIQSQPTFSCENGTTFSYTAITKNQNSKYKWTSFGSDYKFQPHDSAQSVTLVRYSSAADKIYSVNKLESNTIGVYAKSLSSGCKSNIQINDTLWRPNALIFPNKNKGCVPLDVTFSDSSTTFSKNKIIQWEWIFGDGSPNQINAINNPVSHTYVTPGEYNAKLIVTTEKGCKDTSYVQLIQAGNNISSEIDFTVSKNEVCTGELFTIDITKQSSKVDGYHINAEDNRTFHCSNQTSLDWAYRNTVGPQDISIDLDYNGCISKLTKSNIINVKGAIPKIDYYALCSSPSSFNFKNKSLGNANITWDFGDNTAFSNLDNPIHNYSNTGDYTITLLTVPLDGCPAKFITENIKVRNVQAKFNSDSLLCIKQPYIFDAKKSIDVGTNCNANYSWQFPSEDRRPYTSKYDTASFNFTKAGNQSIKLIVKDDNGCTDTISKKIKVFDININASVDKKLICNPSIVTFKDNSIGDTLITSWNWDFGDNQSALIANTTHTYTTSPQIGSTYPVKLTLTDKIGCVKDTNITISYYKPITNIDVSDNSICFGDTITVSANDFFQGNSSLNFNWDFGNSSTSNKQLNKVYYSSVNSYKIKLNYDEKATGCKGSDSLTVNMQSYPTANFYSNVDTIKVLCAPSPITFTDNSNSNSPITQVWKVLNTSQPTISNPTYQISLQRGTYQIFHSVSTSFGCSDTLIKEIKLYDPRGNFDMDKTSICKGSEINFSIKDTSQVVSYAWDFGDGNSVDNIGQVTHKFNYHPAQGTVKVKLVVFGPDKQCPRYPNKDVNIYKIIADFNRKNRSIPDSIAKDSSICFSEGGFRLFNRSQLASTYMWNFGDGITSSTDSTPVHQYANPGKYTVSLAITNDQYQCVDTIRKDIFVYKNPILTVTTDTVCQGQTLSMFVNNHKLRSKYKWSPSTGLNNDSIYNPIATLLKSKSYEVIEVDSNSCGDTTNVVAEIVEPIQYNKWDTTIVIGDPVTLPATKPNNIYNFNWSPQLYGICDTCNTPLVYPLKDIVYTLNITDKLGCFNKNSEFGITVRPETFVKLPTTFTPNGDGNNDIIYVEGWGVKQLITYQIFNRWGELIFSSNNMNHGWDGTFKGEYQNSDVYVYKVKALDWRDKEIVQEGYINLIK